MSKTERVVLKAIVVVTLLFCISLGVTVSMYINQDLDRSDVEETSNETE